MAVLVRPVTPADADLWTGFRHALWPGADASELRETVTAYFAGGTPLVAAAFLAEVDGRPAGFLEMSLRAYVPGASTVPAPFVEGWYVVAEARRLGVGRALMRVAEEWAMAQGYPELGSDVEVENRLSITAHERLGFDEVERVCYFLKRLTTS